ncbi:PREDICTED: kelch-like protein 10 [Nanorana parkeri]|uniref:kelch-like protein 10 n=1 Tax=Nanorana parkeri TaxID=125878 RepID=UPI0008547E2A|nr:PREDICTED: kelch-like protein 10 [Nanorana parkeri]
MECKMSTTAWSVFNDLRLEDQFCDAIIRVDDVGFSVHKIILSGCSPYFRALFAKRWNDEDKKFYNIPEITPDIMKMIIEYAYHQKVTITNDNVNRLFIAADRFNVLGVARRCSKFLIGQLCAENCVAISRLSKHLCSPELSHKAYAYILHNFQDIVMTSEEFLDMPVTELQDLIQRDELNVKQEEVVFEAIVKWINRNPADRSHQIAILLPKVRMALMESEYFINNVKTNIYVNNSKECRAIIKEASIAMHKLNMNGLCNSDFTKPLTRPRLPCEVLLAIGGWSGGSPTNAIESYDCRAGCWVNVICDEESPRAYHGMAYLNGYVYLIGGFDGIDYFNSVSRFDPVSNIWQQVAPMNCKRCYVSVTVLNNCIYAMGGSDGNMRLSSAECYNPETNQWSLIPPMNEQRSDAKATTLNGKIYICGGYDGDECLSTAEMYCPVTNQWRMIAFMSTQRTGLGVAAYGDQMYAVGGFNGSERLRTAEAYNPANNTWHQIPLMLTGRSNFGIEVVDDRLYVIGGFNGSDTTSEAECYDDRTNKWYYVHNMNIVRSALSCCTISNLPNVRDYAAREDSFSNEEVGELLSVSPLPV